MNLGVVAEVPLTGLSFDNGLPIDSGLRRHYVGRGGICRGAAQYRARDHR